MIVLPRLGPRDADGRHTKLGLDDRLVLHGAEEFRQALTRSKSARDLEAFRYDILTARYRSLGSPGIYFDGSPTGAGKTRADAMAIARTRSSLTIVPSHHQCDELEALLNGMGIPAVAYPPLDEKTCQNYETAQQALEYGLPVATTICPACPYRTSCAYHRELNLAQTARHRIATHQRASRGLPRLVGEAEYVAIHEDPIGLFRPLFSVSEGFREMISVADLGYCKALNTFDREAQAYFEHLTWVAKRLLEIVQSVASDCCYHPPDKTVYKPRNADARLFECLEHFDEKPPADIVQTCRALAVGEIDAVLFRVHPPKGDSQQPRRAVLSVGRQQVPGQATIWISDATANVDTMEHVLERSVVDATPTGSLPRLQRVVQVATDITQRTSPRVVARHVRGVLDQFPGTSRVGIIGHKKQMKKLLADSLLDQATRSRIARAGHFRGTTSRGSNAWQQDCDLLIVLGTPRVPPGAVQERLLQLGLFLGALRPGEWSWDYWSGVTEQGRRKTVDCLAYRDHDWHFAYQTMVRSELLQAVGRARGNCGDGIPAVVISNEPLDLPLADWELRGLSESELKVLDAMRLLSVPPPAGDAALNRGNGKHRTGVAAGVELRDISPNRDSIGKMSLSPTNVIFARQLVELVGLSERQVNRLLANLREMGHLEKVGKRGGWRLRSLPTWRERDP